MKTPHPAIVRNSRRTYRSTFDTDTLSVDDALPLRYPTRMHFSIRLAFFILVSLLTACNKDLIEDTADRLTEGDLCVADVECASGNCECEDFECLSRVCAPDNCVCGYGTSGSCDSPMEGGYDPEDCDLGAEVCGPAIGDCLTE